MKKSIKTALITGGSSGIGFALAKLFANDGYNLVIVSLPQDELDRAKQYFEENCKDIDVVTYQKDLSLQTAAKEVYDFVKSQDIDVDILVNNAGFGAFGDFDKIPMEKELAMMNLCTNTLYQLTRYFIPEMIEKDSGRVLNVASAVAYSPTPYMAAYSAAKSFVWYYSKAINYELQQRNSKVTVTTLCPPNTKTGFEKSTGMDKHKLFDNAVEPEVVAAAAYEAMFNGKSVAIPGIGNVIGFNMMRRVLPEKMLFNILKKQMDK